MKKGISFIFTLSVVQKPVLFFSIRTRWMENIEHGNVAIWNKCPALLSGSECFLLTPSLILAVDKFNRSQSPNVATSFGLSVWTCTFLLERCYFVSVSFSTLNVLFFFFLNLLLNTCVITIHPADTLVSSTLKCGSKRSFVWFLFVTFLFPIDDNLCCRHHKIRENTIASFLSAANHVRTLPKLLHLHICI